MFMVQLKGQTWSFCKISMAIQAWMRVKVLLRWKKYKSRLLRSVWWARIMALNPMIIVWQIWIIWSMIVRYHLPPSVCDVWNESYSFSMFIVLTSMCIVSYLLNGFWLFFFLDYVQFRSWLWLYLMLMIWNWIGYHLDWSVSILCMCIIYGCRVTWFLVFIPMVHML